MSDNSTTKVNYSQVLHQPFFDELSDCKRIMIAGCGGGYDFFSGLPLFFGLEKAGATCFLANVAFTNESFISQTEIISPGCYKVTSNSRRSNQTWNLSTEIYWPELYVSHWFKEKENRDVPVYMFIGCGVKTLNEAYKILVETLQLDAIILADGGTDSLMFGNEHDLGTPTEDMTSIAAVHQLTGLKKKFLVNLGFGIDCFHGVNHSLYLENMSMLSKIGGFLGCFSLHYSMDEAKKFEEIYTTSIPENSIVCSSILSSVKGEFGNYHSPYTRERTLGSHLYICPLMSIYFTFSLGIVAEHILYLHLLYGTKSLGDVRTIIHNFRNQLPRKRDPKVIPY